MNWQALVAKLKSNNDDVALDALYTLGGEKEQAPTADVIETAASFIDHAEAEHRARAAFALGIHWQIENLATRFVQRLFLESDAVALSAVVSALTVYVQHNTTRSAAIAALTKFIEDETQSRRFRVNAYMGIKKSLQLITVDDYLREVSRWEEVEMDISWLRSLPL
jgi:hypothetical protein